MTNEKLNEYIKHYFEEDKTKSAIMLTGNWGSGKSHYINTNLLPFLMEDGKSRGIVVSLYGIKDISEISKSIYLELRTKMLRSNNEAVTAGKLLAKTVAKGVTSFWGIDLSASENEMKKLYESVDLSDKLVVLEDIERSQIDILEILGYVNNLVEQDGIKVLLVANEAELLEYEEIASDNTTEKREWRLTKKSLRYLKAKEKTISDTITFTGDYFSAIHNIITDFKDKHLSLFLEEKYIQEICELLRSCENENLRTFIYACQKTADILSIIEDLVEFDDKRTIFYSIIIFAKRIKAGKFPKWEGTEWLSTDLGSNSFPLYFFCYEYIRWQEFEIESVTATIAEHKKMKLYQHHANDPDLDILRTYYIQPENAVLNALNNIVIKLQDPDAIPFYEYGNLAFYFVVCGDLLEFDYSDAKSSMIKNIHEKGSEVDGDMLFLSVGKIENVSHEQLFKTFKEDLLQAIKDSNKVDSDEITYSPEDISEYYTYVAKNRLLIQSKRRYMSTFDIDQLEAMIFACTAEQLQDVRGILFAVYRYCQKGDFIEADIDFMTELKHRIEMKMKNSDLVTDRIILLQLRYLCDNLQQFTDQLS